MSLTNTSAHRTLGTNARVTEACAWELFMERRPGWSAGRSRRRGGSGACRRNGGDFRAGRGPVGLGCLIGLNGAGKTSLMRIALGIIRPQAGSFRLFGQLLADLPPAKWAEVGALFEIPPGYPELTVRKNLHIARWLQGGSPG